MSNVFERDTTMDKILEMQFPCLVNQFIEHVETTDPLEIIQEILDND